MKNEIQVPAYVTEVELTETTDGNPVYEARHPELPLALGQGNTPNQAIADLAVVTEAFLEHYREHGVPIPEPLRFGSQPFPVLMAPKSSGTAAIAPVPRRNVKARNVKLFAAHAADVFGLLTYS